MHRRPFPIILLAVLHLLLPVFYIFNSYRVSNIPFQFFFRLDFLIENWVVLFNFTIPLWIASFAIWKCHKWSYTIFLVAMIWISGRSFYNAYTVEDVSAMNAFLAIFINIFIITYFLKPSIKTLYMEPNLRWWEREIRYKRTLKGIIDKKIDGEIQNISLGGIFIQVKETLEIGREVQVAFDDPHYNDEFYFQGEVVYATETGGVGIRFFSLSSELLKPYKKYMQTLKKNRVPRTYMDEGWAREFVKWIIGKKA